MAGKLSGSAIQAGTITLTQLSGGLNDTTNAAYGQANTAYSQANAAYGAANNRVLKAGDTMTGQLNISSGGLLVTGNVGIGTTNPGSKLHVVGVVDSQGLAATEGASLGYAANRWMVQFEGSSVSRSYACGADATTRGTWEHYAAESDGNPLNIFTAAASGNFGIGTTSPVEKLEVNGANTSIAAYNNSISVGSGFTRLKLGRDNAYNAGLSAYVASGQPGVDRVNLGFHVTTFTSSLQTFYEAMTITDAGNVGIGTTSPNNQGLHIRQEGGDRRVLLQLDRPNTPGLQSAIEFTVGGSIMVGRIQHEYEASNQNHMSFSLRSPSSVNFEVMRLKNDGNIGIGTTNPGAKLHLNNGSSTAYLRITGRDRETYFGQDSVGCAVYSSGSVPMYFVTNDVERMRIDASGNITQNNQPAFVAYATDNQEPTSTTKILYGATNLNRGSHYNTSTSRFTAPVTGLYSFNVRWWYRIGSTELAQLWIYKNGGAIIETRFQPTSAAPQYITQLFKSTVYLVAGDYVEVYASGGGGNAFHSSTSYFYSEFSGYLLG